MMEILLLTGIALFVIYLYEKYRGERLAADRAVLNLALKVEFAKEKSEIEALFKEVSTELDNCTYIDIKVYLGAIKDVLKSKLNEL